MQHVLAKMMFFVREPNPILVRELKQFVRNRLLLYFMLVYLVVISLVTVVVLAMPELVQGVHLLFFSFSECNGLELFAFLMISYYLFTSVFLVLFGSIKLGFERYKNDLGYYTTVAPWRIISGKFLLGVAVSLIFLSILLPFLTIAYMMRGLGLSTIIFAVLFCFFMTLVHYSVTITFFSGARTLVRIYLFGLILAFLHFIGFWLGLAGSMGFTHASRGPNFYLAFIPYLIQWAFIFFPIPFAVCQVSPESSNRMMPVRVCMTLFFLFIALLSIATLSYEIATPVTPEYLAAIGLVCVVAMICIGFFYPILFLIFICEREKYSIRQRRSVPRNGLLRLLYFIHATGVYNAILWYFLFLVASIVLFGVLYFLVSYHKSSGFIDTWDFGIKEVCWRYISFDMMVFSWAVAAFYFWKIGLNRFLSREWLSFPLLCFGVIASIFYYVVGAVLPYRSMEMISIIFSIFPVIVGNEAGTKLQYFFGIVGVIIFMSLSGIGIADAVARLSPYEGTKVLTEAELQEAVQKANRERSPLPSMQISEKG